MREEIYTNSDWVIYQKNPEEFYIMDEIPTPESEHIASVYGYQELGLRRANLIAAAPDLLKVCEKLLDGWKNKSLGESDFYELTVDLMPEFEKAIAKTKGQTDD